MVGALAFLVCFPAFADLSEQEAVSRAARIYSLLSGGGAFLDPASELGKNVVNLVRAEKYNEAAHEITHPLKGEPAFYRVTVAETNRAFNRFNAPTASMTSLETYYLGHVMLDLPAREFLAGNKLIYGVGLPNGTMTPTDDNAASLGKIAFTRANLNAAEIMTSVPSVGVVAYNSFGSNFIQAGTNRRIWLGLVNHVFCSRLEALRSIPPAGYDEHVGVDLNRNSAEFPVDCISCHWTMDQVRRYFARFDHNGTALTYGAIKDKHNETNSPLKAITQDFGRFQFGPVQHAILGFRDADVTTLPNGVRYIEVSGPADFMSKVADSTGANKCHVLKAYYRMRFGTPFTPTSLTPEQEAEIQSPGVQALLLRWAEKLQTNQKFREIFEGVAVEIMNAERGGN